MRAECIRAIEELALSDPKVVVVTSDPNTGFMAQLAERHPERLMIEGVCEQGLAGMAAGLASEGFYPFVITLAVFATRRCYEQLLLDFALHQLPGCIVGYGGGFAYAALGPTHIAVDDMLLFSGIPGSAILTPAEPHEAIVLTKQARAFAGLSYMRMTWTTESLPLLQGEVVLGKGRLLGEPAEVLFVSCGAATFAVQSALKILGEGGIIAGAIHLPTVKPLDVEMIRHHARTARAVLCVEEHRQIGGLASAVLHALTSADSPNYSARIASIGVDDTFPSGNGDPEDLLDYYGMTGASLAEKARTMLLSIARNP